MCHPLYPGVHDSLRYLKRLADRPGQVGCKDHPPTCNRVPWLETGIRIYNDRSSWSPYYLDRPGRSVPGFADQTLKLAKLRLSEAVTSTLAHCHSFKNVSISFPHLPCKQDPAQPLRPRSLLASPGVKMRDSALSCTCDAMRETVWNLGELTTSPELCVSPRSNTAPR